MADKIERKVVPVAASVVKQIESDDAGERRITFVASSNGVDRHYETVDVASLRLPLKGGGSLKVAEIPEEGVSDIVDIPLMLNHSGDVRDIIGSVRKAFFRNGELVFEAGISSLDTAQEMLTLIEEGHLSNAFSITMIDFDYNFDSETISNAEVIEVSLVYRGSNKEARLLAIKSLLGGKMPEAEKAKEVEAETQAVEEPTETTEEVNAEAEAPAESEAEEKAEGEVEEKEAETETEATDEEETNEPEKEEEAMDKEDVKAQVTEKAAPTQATANNNYLNTKAAVKDFAEVLLKNATGEVADVREAWGAHVASKGISNPEVLLPTALVTAITDAVEKAGTIWQLVDKTGLTVYHTAMNTIGIDVEEGRAKGHKGKGAEKAEQVITLADRVIRAQYIYKYLTLPKEVIRENQDTGALVAYVLTELPNRVVAEVERAIVIGDGRDDASDDKIKSFVSIKADALDNASPYATKYEKAASENLYEALVKAAAQIDAEGEIYCIMSRTNKAELKLTKSGDTYAFGLNGNVADAIEVKDILTPSFMKNDDAVAYLVVFKEYKTVGDNASEAFTNFALKENKQEYLQEIYAGGALAMPGAAVAIVNA